MNTKLQWFVKLSTRLITVIIPPLLMVSSILALLNHVFLDLEYRRPGFPADTMGFTLADRLKYARASVAYLVNSQGIESLQELEFSDGTALYNERELSHMVDVKAVVQGSLRWYLVGVILFVILTALAIQTGNRRVFWESLSWGGFLTVAIVLFFLVYLALNFDSLFSQFHKLFFESGSWVFYYSDSLIRLFPLPFWQDCFIVVGSLSLLGGTLLGWQGRKHSRH
jgi:integral membrane protein (TIGR01906 family)